MLGRFEDFAAIGALPFEHGARIVQAVRANVERGVLPRDELAVIPDHAVEPVVGFIHGGSSSRLRPTAIRQRGLSVVAAFASRTNTRYVSLPMRARLRGRSNNRAGRPYGTILSPGRMFR